MRRASLALGVGRDLLVAVAAAALGVLLSLTVQLQASEQELRQQSLRAAAQYMASHLQFEVDGTAHLPPVPGSSWATFGYPTLVFDAAGNLLFQRPSELDPSVAQRLARERLIPGERQETSEAIGYFKTTLGEERIIGATLRIGSGAGARTIQVFKDENAPDVLIDDIVREFPYRSLRVLLPAFALLLLAGFWIVRRRTRPVATVAAIAKTIGPHTLDLRLPEHALPGEVLPIVRAINQALARLEQSAEQQREFLRRAAHQLRTPLTVLSARAAGLDDSEIGRQLRADVEEVARILTQLLQLNEIDTLPEPTQRFADLAAVAVAVLEVTAPAAAQRDVFIELERHGEPMLVYGDPNLIEVAVRNIVENAVQHSPTGGRIKIRFDRPGSLTIADSGTGIQENLREKIFQPFWSGDTTGARAGLGLTIVRRIAERCGAAVSVDNGADGGAIFTMRFRPADAGSLDSLAVRATRPAGASRQYSQA